jgi:glycosidase
VGLLGETDPDCRRCMPWDKKDWNLPVYQMTRDLIQLRHAHPALRNGKPQKIAAFNGMFSYLMKEGNDEVVVILNPREAIPDFSFKIQSVNQYWKEFQTGKSFTLQSGEIHLETIPARSALVLLPENH